MSGHSKWNNIKRKKEKTDGARAKVFTKIGREISVAVRDALHLRSCPAFLQAHKSNFRPVSREKYHL